MNPTRGDRSLLDVLVFVPGAFYVVLFAMAFFSAPASGSTLDLVFPAIAFLLLAAAHRSQATRIRAVEAALRERQ